MLRLIGDQRVAFLFVGILNTLIGYAFFAGFEVTIGHAAGYIVVLLLSHVASVICAFVLYRRLVFDVRGNVLRELVRFELVYLTSILVNLALLPALVELAGLPVLPAQALIVFVSAGISFIGHRHFTFRRPGAPTGRAESPGRGLAAYAGRSPYISQHRSPYISQHRRKES